MSTRLGTRFNTLDPFLGTLSPGTGVVLQYDCRPPAFGIFQGFQAGTVLVSNFNGFPGLTRIRADRVNAVSPFNGFSPFFNPFTPFPFFGFNQFSSFDGFNPFF